MTDADLLISMMLVIMLMLMVLLSVQQVCINIIVIIFEVCSFEHEMHAKRDAYSQMYSRESCDKEQ